MRDNFLSKRNVLSPCISAPISYGAYRVIEP